MSNDERDDWEKLFQQLPVDTTVRDEHCKQLKAQVLSNYQKPRTHLTLQFRLHQIGRTLMRYKIPHCTAATILVALVVWLAQVTSTPLFALDQVVKNIMQARSARFDVAATVAGQPMQKMKGYFLEPNHFRQELTSGYIHIADWQAGKMIGLDPNSKQAMVFNLVNIAEDAKRKMQANQFEVIRESLRQAMANPDKKVEQLGKKQLDGRTVIGFRFLSGPLPMTLWADPQTNFPVRIEMTMVGSPQTEVVMSNYEFNVDLDKSLFNVTVPEGYQVVQANLDASSPTEKDFITALRMCAQTTGEFPTGYDAMAVGKYVALYLVKQGIEKDKYPTGAQMEEAVRIGRGFQFALMLPTESDSHYSVAGAKIGDAERAIFWYRPSGSATYRVIYADFTVKESATAPKK